MAGFPFAAIGAGVGQGVEAIQQQRLRDIQAAQMRLQLQRQQQEDQAGKALWPALLSGGLDAGQASPLGTGGLNLPGSTVPSFESGGGFTSPQTMAQPRTQSGADMGGGLRAGGALTSDRFLDLAEKYESGGRNIKQQVVPPGGGYNPSVGRVTGPSSAQGYYQITDSTWRDAAPKAGVDLAAYPNAMSAPKAVQRQVAQAVLQTQGPGAWTNYNPKLAAAVGGAGGAGADPVMQTVQQTVSTIPSQVYGRMSLQALAAQIEKANPGADPVVKMMALERANKLMAPTEQRMWEMFRMQHDDAFRMMLQDRQDTRQTERETAQDERQMRLFGQQEKLRDAGVAGKGWQIQTLPDGGGMVRVNPNTGEVQPVNLPTGTTKQGTQAQAGGDPKTVDFVAQGIAKYDMAPLSGWAMRSPYGQQVMAKVFQINPEYDQTKYGAKARGQVAFTSGRQGDTVRSFSVAIDHLGTMEDAAQALANNDVRSLNRLTNEISREFGYSGPVDFTFVKSIVGAEVSKAVIGGVGALKDREELRGAFDAANSPEQLASVARQAKRLMAGQLGGYRRQAAGAGFSEKQFDAALSPRAKQELTGLGGATGAAQQPVAPSAAPPPAAIEELKKNPSLEMQKAFDQVFGDGAAAAAIGK